MRRALVATLLGWTLALPAAAATEWAVDHGQSRLTFTNWWEGEAFTSEFERWRAETLRFSPDDLEDSRFDIRIDLTSVDTGSGEANEAIAEPEWFDLESFTTARYVTSGFTAAGDGDFRAQGELTLKGITAPLDLEIEWEPTADGARLTGSARLDRTRFNVGTGEWSSGDTIGLEVLVEFALTLSPATGE